MEDQQRSWAIQNMDMFLGGHMWDEYRLFVDKKMKSGEDILAKMTPLKADLSHSARGVATEAGEFNDAIKRWVDYDRQLDVDNVIEEAGDLLFYLTNALTKLGIPIEVVIDRNVTKLNKRYKSGYTDAEAEARADKETEQ